MTEVPARRARPSCFKSMAADVARDAAGRPLSPSYGDPKDPEIFYTNVAYKVNRVAINIEKMKVNADLRGGTDLQAGRLAAA